MNPKLINFVIFQVGWFSCVLSAASGMPWLGLVIVSSIVANHLLRANKPSQEAQLVLLAVVFGLVVDSLLVSSGWLRYPSGVMLSNMAPYWILAMWALFATTLNSSMSWLKGKALLASVMGAVFGPLSYMAGQRLGAIEFIDGTRATIALALAWSIAMPVLMSAASRLSGRNKLVTVEPLQKLPKKVEY